MTASARAKWVGVSSFLGTAMAALSLLACGGSLGTTVELGRLAFREGKSVVVTLPEPVKPEHWIALCLDPESLRRAGFSTGMAPDSLRHAAEPEMQVFFLLQDGSELRSEGSGYAGGGHCYDARVDGCGQFVCSKRVRAIRIESKVDLVVDQVWFKTRTPA
jgi:hypothetical protein